MSVQLVQKQVLQWHESVYGLVRMYHTEQKPVNQSRQLEVTLDKRRYCRIVKTFISLKRAAEFTLYYS